MKKDDFTAYVKSIYPNMIEDYWFQYGELHFYRNSYHAKQQNHGPAYTQMVSLKFLLNFKCIPSLAGQCQGESEDLTNG
mgnify:CR=1 FL=1